MFNVNCAERIDYNHHTNKKSKWPRNREAPFYSVRDTGICLSLNVLGQQDKDRRGSCGVSIILCLSIDLQPSKEDDKGFVSSKEMKDEEWTQATSLDSLHWLIVKSLAFSWTFGIGQFYITIWNGSTGFWIKQGLGLLPVDRMKKVRAPWGRSFCFHFVFIFSTPFKRKTTLCYMAENSTEYSIESSFRFQPDF